MNAGPMILSPTNRIAIACAGPQNMYEIIIQAIKKRSTSLDARFTIFPDDVDPPTEGSRSDLS